MHRLVPGEELADPMTAYVDVDRTPVNDCWVMGHMVGGLDGSAAIQGRVGALSDGPDARLYRRMRAVADVVLIGAETVRREGYAAARLDDAARRARTERGLPPTPPVAIVSRSLDLDFDGRAFTAADPASPTFVVTCAAADAGRRARAAQAGEVVIAGDERVEPAAALAELAARGFGTVLCEGGPTLLGEVVALGLLDELLLTIAPLMGGDALPVSVTPPGAPLERFRLRQVLNEADTLFLRYQRDRQDETDDLAAGSADE